MPSPPPVYTDHANDPIDDNNEHDNGGSNPVTFPNKLMAMLEQVDKEDLGHIVGWQPHGRSFIVRDPQAFCEQIMPRFFAFTKLGSWQRQLALYSFERILAGPDRGSYYHELFLRLRPHLLKRMRRTSNKGVGVRRRKDPSQQPNFSSMLPVGPIPSPSTLPAPPAPTCGGAGRLVSPRPIPLTIRPDLVPFKALFPTSTTAAEMLCYLLEPLPVEEPPVMTSETGVIDLFDEVELDQVLF